jgi:hypothetical protein
MIARETPALPEDAQRDLENFLRKSGRPLSVAEAARCAVKAWLAEQTVDAEENGPHLGGYQWKNLFLPNGTEVRMTFDGRSFYAAVEGDRIVYAGRPISPRQLTLAIAGDGRNAWRELWVRYPGEKKWRRANDLRRELSKLPVQPPPSPLEAMSHAAANMKAALESTLALLDKTTAIQTSKLERRLDKHRRSTDFVQGDVPFDGD